MSTNDYARSYANHPANGPKGNHFQLWEAELAGTDWDKHVADADKLIGQFANYPKIAPRIEKMPKPAMPFLDKVIITFFASALVGIAGTAIFVGLGYGNL